MLPTSGSYELREMMMIRNCKHLPKTNYDTSLLIQTAKLLKYLVEFYGIDDYRYWGKTHSEWDMTDEGQPDEGHSDGGESHSELSMSLEEAVKEYPTRAVEKLAAVLGLVERISQRSTKGWQDAKIDLKNSLRNDHSHRRIVDDRLPESGNDSDGNGTPPTPSEP
jgi:predicted house-cleaning noncanonical NTP pyrophosphatase (MazG superfamily)